jgi:hypothetical protein
MSLIDKNGRIFGKLNIIDLIVFVVIILVVGVTGYRMFGDSIAGGLSTRDVLIEVTCPQKPEVTAKAFVKGELLVSGSSFIPDTAINAVTYTPSVDVAPDQSGKQVMSADPVLKDIVITVKAKLGINSAVMKIGGQEVQVGTEFTVKTQHASVKGVISKVTIP